MSSLIAKRKSAETLSVWWGENTCEKCSNKAYYAVGDHWYCGVHSRNLKRTELRKNPNAAERTAAILKQREEIVEAAMFRNRQLPRGCGALTVAKLRMMREPPHVDGVRNVFPNNKHQERKDGFGCASLSPMRLGPVKHGQPSVPDALTIENYHQFNKVFEREVTRDKEDLATAIVKSSFFTARDAAYRDPVPHRHKFPNEKGVGGNKNVPLFSLHVAPDGTPRRYTYLESRFFYCHQYELLAKQQKDFHDLSAMLKYGYNLQIVGYDGYPVTKPIMEHYLDTERPFGHEMVLYCLLSIPKPADYPWNIFHAQHRALYE